MMKSYEMLVIDYFKLSTGQVALTGTITPDISGLLTSCKADLYIGDEKICSINIDGEDKFSRVKEEVRKNKRAVRTRDDIYENLKSAGDKKIRLVFLGS